MWFPIVVRCCYISLLYFTLIARCLWLTGSQKKWRRDDNDNDVTCGLTGSAQGPTLGKEYRRALPITISYWFKGVLTSIVHNQWQQWTSASSLTDHDTFCEVWRQMTNHCRCPDWTEASYEAGRDKTNWSCCLTVWFCKALTFSLKSFSWFSCSGCWCNLPSSASSFKRSLVDCFSLCSSCSVFIFSSMTAFLAASKSLSNLLLYFFFIIPLLKVFVFLFHICTTHVKVLNPQLKPGNLPPLFFYLSFILCFTVSCSLETLLAVFSSSADFCAATNTHQTAFSENTAWWYNTHRYTLVSYSLMMTKNTSSSATTEITRCVLWFDLQNCWNCVFK